MRNTKFLTAWPALRQGFSMGAGWPAHRGAMVPGEPRQIGRPSIIFPGYKFDNAIFLGLAVRYQMAALRWRDGVPTARMAAVPWRSTGRSRSRGMRLAVPRFQRAYRVRMSPLTALQPGRSQPFSCRCQRCPTTVAQPVRIERGIRRFSRQISVLSGLAIHRGSWAHVGPVTLMAFDSGHGLCHPDDCPTADIIALSCRNCPSRTHVGPCVVAHGGGPTNPEPGPGAHCAFQPRSRGRRRHERTVRAWFLPRIALSAGSRRPWEKRAAPDAGRHGDQTTLTLMDPTPSI